MADTVKNGGVRPPKPARPESRPENLPRLLKTSAKFCVWNYAWDDKKQRYIKMPYSLRTGKGCRCNTEDDFCTFDEAVKALPRYDGIGVGIFHELVGVDIDHCVDDQRTLSAMAQDIVQTIGSYTEISPSGHGVRILLTVSEDFAKNHFADREAYKARYKTKRDDIGLEIYVAGMTSRYLTVTGNATMQSRYLEQRDAELLKVLDKYMRQPKKPAEAQPVREETASPGASTPSLCNPLLAPEPVPEPAPKPEPVPAPAPVSSPAPVSLSDRELIGKIVHSAQGQKFRDLWNGNWQKYYSSQSSADMALCGTLAFWTGKDAARMESLFSRSALGQRGKWKDRQDYRSWTIQHAIDGCTDAYSTDDTPLEWDAEINDAPEPQHRPQTQAQTVSESQPQTQTESTQTVQPGVPEKSEPEIQIAEPVPGQGKPSPIQEEDNVACYMDAFIGSDFVRFTDSAIKTGFSNLDKCCDSLYAGIYTIAAVSSLGKTSFTLQLCDQIAAQGQNVLFFSLEQSRADLVSKSVARTEAQMGTNKEEFISSHKMKMGKTSHAQQQAFDRYRAKIAPHMNIIVRDFSMSYKDIKQYIVEYIEVHSEEAPPVVVIDYLQIVAPPESLKKYRSTKDTVDETITALKRLSRKYNLTVIAICSVNRQNYLTPIDFESLKESGGIEFTADCVWGLQLQCLTTDKLFTESNEGDKKTRKRERIKEEKAKCPRDVSLVCLKNRYGISSYECYFQYDCKRDLFIENGYDMPDERGMAENRKPADTAGIATAEIGKKAVCRRGTTAEGRI